MRSIELGERPGAHAPESESSGSIGAAFATDGTDPGRSARQRAATGFACRIESCASKITTPHGSASSPSCGSAPGDVGNRRLRTDFSIASFTATLVSSLAAATSRWSLSRISTRRSRSTPSCCCLVMSAAILSFIVLS